MSGFARSRGEGRGDVSAAICRGRLGKWKLGAITHLVAQASCLCGRVVVVILPKSRIAARRVTNTCGGTGILPVPMLTRGWNRESEDAVVARRSKLNWLIAGVAVQAFSAAVALAEESPAKPTPTFSAQFLYWA